MKPRFNPDRQGASHILERSDIAIVRGTPVYGTDGRLHDNRIRISENGLSERALWIHCPMDFQNGLRSEFHRWTSQVDEKTLREIVLVLQNLTHSEECDVTKFSNDTLLCIRHWDGGKERTSFVLNGNEQYHGRVKPVNDERAFWKAWNLIQDSIPGIVSFRPEVPSDGSESTTSR